ncbi:MAG: ABC transporter substrate-binding protein [Acidimicrobiales bacterium]
MGQSDSDLVAGAPGRLAAPIDRREFLRMAGVAGLSVAAASSLLAACGNTSGSGKGGSSSSKTLVYGPLGDAKNFDPATNGLDYSAPPFSSIYEGLTTYIPGGPWTVHNLLAESVEQSTDGLVYSFKLKEGMQFHGGYGEVTAADVKYSFERSAGLQPLYPNAPKSAVSYYAGDFPNLVGVTVTGKYTGKVTFSQPFIPFETITLPFATSSYIIPEKAVAKYGSAWPLHPIGTGPYEVVSYTPNSEMVLHKFADYGGANANLGTSHDFDEIRMVLTPLNSVPTGEALTIPLQSGEVDFTPALGELDLKRLKGNSGFSTYEPVAALNYSFLSLDVKNSKLKDVRVRDAIRYALDIDEIITADGVPLSTRQDALISPQMAVGYWSGAPHYARDVAKAKTLLAQAGASSLSIEIAAPTIATLPGEPNEVMQVIQANLQEAGITVNIVETPPNSYTATPGAGQLTWGQFGGAPDPYYQFEWFTCSQVGTWNYASWCNPQYSSFEKELGSTVDTSRRQQIAVQMQELMNQAVPFVFMHYGVNFAASTKSVQAVFDGNGNPSLQYFRAV